MRFRTIRTVIFLIAGKLDFSKLNPYVAQPTWNSTEPLLISGRRLLPLCFRAREVKHTLLGRKVEAELLEHVEP